MQITPGKLLRELQCQELLYSVARGASAGAAGAVQGAAGRLGAAGGTQRAYALLRDLNTDAETVRSVVPGGAEVWKPQHRCGHTAARIRLR